MTDSNGPTSDAACNGVQLQGPLPSDQSTGLSSETASNGVATARRTREIKMQVMEAVGLAVLIGIVWALLLLPIIFYHLPVMTAGDNVSIVYPQLDLAGESILEVAQYPRKSL